MIFSSSIAEQGRRGGGLVKLRGENNLVANFCTYLYIEAILNAPDFLENSKSQPFALNFQHGTEPA